MNNMVLLTLGENAHVVEYRPLSLRVTTHETWNSVVFENGTDMLPVFGILVFQELFNVKGVSNVPVGEIELVGTPEVCTRNTTQHHSLDKI